MIDSRLWMETRALVEQALREDLGPGDFTTRALFSHPVPCRGEVIAGQEMILAGGWLLGLVFQTLDERTRVEPLVEEGGRVQPGAVIARVQGDGVSILGAERTALNFVQRLSAIATLTARFVEAVRGTRARILDTRKTTPGWRSLEKYAVRVGGGKNHRHSLGDGILIKDNHLALARDLGGLIGAVRRVREQAPHPLKVEVEAETLDQVRDALAAEADIILLDNMSQDLTRQAVDIVKGRALLEVSGGIRLENVRAFAMTGVDFISVGALTHSAPAVDLSLELHPAS